MEVLKFIFGLGVAFSIFGFIWVIIMLGINMIRGSYQNSSKQIQDYVLRIIKYFLLVSVTANYIAKYQGDDGSISIINMILGVAVLGMYLMGKLQRRTLISQFSKHPMFTRFSTSIDPKVERFLLSGSLVYFIFCLQFPSMVDNGIVNWFTSSIVGIYETPVIGWVFSIIAFFFLVSTIFRGANVIGSLVTGQPIDTGGRFGNFGNFQNNGTNPFEQFRQKQQQDDGFVDYEDVTDEDEN